MAETGFFPSVDNRGRRRMSGNQQINELRVRGLKDGFIRSFDDDGASKAGPNQARLELCRKVTARDKDSGLPLVYVDERVPPIQGPGGIMVEVPVVNDEIKKAQAVYLAKRAEDAMKAIEQVQAKYNSQAQVAAAALAPEAVIPKAPRAPRRGADNE